MMLHRNPLLWINIAAVVVMVLAWQGLALLFANQDVGALRTPLIPGWDMIFRESLPAMENYRAGSRGLGLDEGSVMGGIAVLADHAVDTCLRLFTGLALGALLGVGIALLVSMSRIARAVAALPGHILRTLPVLAMVPLVQVWFGVSFTGMVAFVAFGAGGLLFVGTLNAVANVPQHYIDAARSLGASRLRVYRTVILPAIFAELQSSIVLCLALSWSIVVGAEFLGAQSGLGFIQVQAKQFALLDRMVVVALVFLLFSTVIYLAFDRLSRFLLRWQPDTRD